MSAPEPIGYLCRHISSVTQALKHAPGEDTGYLWKYTHGTKGLAYFEGMDHLEVQRIYVSPPPAQPATVDCEHWNGRFCGKSGACYRPSCIPRATTAAQPACACNDALRLYAYAGGADDAGLYGRLWVNVEGESVEYARATAQPKGKSDSPAQPTREPLTDDVLDTVSNAMKRAWQLGQTYWQQADSESYSANKKSDATHRKFMALIDETRSTIERLTLGEQPK